MSGEAVRLEVSLDDLRQLAEWLKLATLGGDAVWISRPSSAGVFRVDVWPSGRAVVSITPVTSLVGADRSVRSTLTPVPAVSVPVTDPAVSSSSSRVELLTELRAALAQFDVVGTRGRARERDLFADRLFAIMEAVARRRARPFAVGDRVRVVSGEYAGVIGRISEFDCARADGCLVELGEDGEGGEYAVDFGELERLDEEPSR